MEPLCSWRWVEEEIEETIELWQQSAGPWISPHPHYPPREQQQRENAYDRALREIDGLARKSPRFRPAATRERVVALFARFAAIAFDLDSRGIDLLTHKFLPVGTQFARWSRRFDTVLSAADIAQGCRNAWTACGLQPLLGADFRLTPAILAYSLLYPYSDNYLDQPGISGRDKLRFNDRFRCRLRGEPLAAEEDREMSIWELVRLIEDEFPRERFPCVFDSLLAIHRAQEQSMAQLGARDQLDEREILRISCAKGGTSVLADACLVRGYLTGPQSHFAFVWGVLLQLGDDLQDIEEDLERGSDTLFTRAIRRGEPLDALVLQLLNFSECVAALMDALPHGDSSHKHLLRMSWRSLILMSVARTHAFFTPALLAHLEQRSPFRFAFLRARRSSLQAKSGLFQRLFDTIVASGEESENRLPDPRLRRNLLVQAPRALVAECSLQG